MITAVAADEPPGPERQQVVPTTTGPMWPHNTWTIPTPQPLAVGGIIPAGSVPLIGDEGCALTLPVDSSRIDSAGNVHVTVTIPDGPLAESLRANALHGLSIKPPDRSPSMTAPAGTREAFTDAAKDRHPATQHVVQYFAWAHLPEHLGAVSSAFGLLALNLLLLLEDGPELTVALRHLLEAKDAAVRAALDVTPAEP